MLKKLNKSGDCTHAELLRPFPQRLSRPLSLTIMQTHDWITSCVNLLCATFVDGIASFANATILEFTADALTRVHLPVVACRAQQIYPVQVPLTG